MMQLSRRVRRGTAIAVATLSTGLLGAFGQSATATHNTVTSVTGSAYGYHAYNITLFGGAQAPTGPTPTVSLAADASNSPQTATASSGLVAYGPTLFSSGAITVRTEGSLGTTGSVTSSADITNPETETSGATTGQGDEVFDADRVQSTCTASESGTSGTTTITNGVVRTHAQSFDHGEGIVAVPTNPEPNTKIAGHLHLSETSTDYFVIVFNEQIVNPDGSITVNAVHQYFGATLDASGNIVDHPQSTLQGDLIIGQVVCDVSMVPTPTTTTEPTTTTTASEPTTTTTAPTTTTTAPSADVRATVEGPTETRAGRRTTISGGVRNFGPSTANDVQFALTLPADFTVAKVTPPRNGTCTQTDQVITCTVDSLGPRKGASVKVTGSFATAGNYTTTVTVSSGSPSDPDTDNNRATLSTQVS